MKQLSFYGAAQNVTGSCYMLESGGRKILIDCGLYQEREFKSRNWGPFPVIPSEISAILLTHAHLDHCGLIPRLVSQGFRGDIYCTETTAEVAKIVLLDSAKIQEEDALKKRKRHARQGRTPAVPVEPLYTASDVEAANDLFSGVEYDTPVLIDGMVIEFIEAGHIIGSSCISVRLTGDGEARTILFSGDIGRKNTAILPDPEPLSESDYVLIESTYGSRNHKDEKDISEMLGQHIRETVEGGGNVVIPSFAVERAQELLYRLYKLRKNNQMPPVPVYLDSPMAMRITEVLRRHPESLGEEVAQMIRNGERPFDFQGLTLCGSVEESKSINEVKGGAVIIAGSGMCTGGRIKHHLINNIGDSRNLILFVGYQARGTLGRQILEGEKKVRILGEDRKVSARVAKVNGFSAHAGQDELLKWLLTLKRAPIETFVVHGEISSSEALAQRIRDITRDWRVTVPAYGETVTLN
jgi:metallo-beta-lactamase family protein